MTPVTRDPLDVPIEEKVALLLRRERSGAEGPRLRFVNSGCSCCARSRRTSTPKARDVTQTFIRVGPSFIGDRRRRRRFPELHRGARAARSRLGVHHSRSTCRATPSEWASARGREARREVGRGRAATISFSIRRISGSRSTSRSVIRPSSIARWATRRTTRARASSRRRRRCIGKLKYGPDFMNIQGDRTQEGSLARVRVGRRRRRRRQVAASSRRASSRTTRRRASRRRGSRSSPASRKSHGCSFADSWDERAVPAHAERLAPARREGHRARRHRRGDRPRHRRSRIAARGRSITSATTSSSPARCSTRCKSGKIAGMLKDVAYQANTPVFWNSHGHDRRQELLLARRLVRRRQGRAVADRTR